MGELKYRILYLHEMYFLFINLFIYILFHLQKVCYFLTMQVWKYSTSSEMFIM